MTLKGPSAQKSAGPSFGAGDGRGLEPRALISGHLGVGDGPSDQPRQFLFIHFSG